MKKLQFSLPLGFLLVAAVAGVVTAADSPEGKAAILASIDSAAEEYWSVALDIWSFAEPGYQEVESAERLVEVLAAAGFTIERGVAGIPTAFVASFRSESSETGPVIGIL